MPKINLGAKPLIEVDVFLDISDPENPKVLLDSEAEKVENKETLFLVKTKWRKPNYNLAQIIEMNQFLDKVFNGQLQRVFDTGALMTARMRVLLREWNLHEVDETLKLEFVKSIDNQKIEILSPASMGRIGDIEPASLMYTIYNKALTKLYPELYGDDLLKNLTSGEEKTE